MRELYAQVNEVINSVDFESIWRGFSAFPFALYNEDKIYLQNKTAPYDQCFLGNTSIEYDGEYIAIWKVDTPDNEDLELLAANLIHEMFHAFQRQNQECRFPDDLLLLGYPENEENYIVKHSENVLLSKAFSAEDTQEKISLLQQFMSARKYRETLIGNIITQEYLSETIEGMAEYAGCMALKQISKVKYDKRVTGYIENLQMLDERFFDIRRMLYDSGTVFCIALIEAGLDFYHIIGDTMLPLFDIAAGDTPASKPRIDIDSSIIELEVNKHTSAKKRKFDEFHTLHNGEITGNWFICGYDPMNMVKMDDEILCSHFISLKSVNDENAVFIQGPVIVNLKKDSVNEVVSYIK